MNSRSWSATSELETFSAVPHSRHITSSSMSVSEARGARGRGRRREHGEGEQRDQRRAHHAGSSSSGGRVSSSHFWVTGKRRTAATLPARSIT